jgi:hypothetical protein
MEENSTNKQDDLNQLSSLLCIRDPDGRPALMIGLSATFLFREPWLRPARQAVANVATEYLDRFKKELKWVRDHRSERAPIYAMSKNRVPLPKEWLANHPDNEEWSIGFHGGESERAASEFTIEAFGVEKYGPPDDLGYLHLQLPLRFLAEHPGEFQKIVLHAAKRIKPLSGYAGIGFLQPVSLAAGERAETLVTPLAARFPGIEVESLVAHTDWCQKGIKGVNWLTILSDRFVEEAGGLDYLRIRLDPNIFPFHKYDGGLVIQAGPHPEVGDATQNRYPRHYVTLAKVLKKIQIKEHRPFHYGGEGRMDKAMSEAWLFRFDGK